MNHSVRFIQRHSASSSFRGALQSGRVSTGSRPRVLGSLDIHTFGAPMRRDEEYQNGSMRKYHTTAPSERVVAVIMGLATVSALGYAGSSAVQSYQEWQKMQPTPEEREEMRKADEAEREKAEAERAEAEKKEAEKPRENFFKQWFDVGGKYYEGGFEDTMTKREAALILGVRESSSPKRIKDAHRKLLILNHPDTGGSTYLAGKLNEAKELLLKGKTKV
eukprot:Nitzschia sp. Nitz4//scaffold45_size130396//65801//66460//NITZ4_003452-RA/size130396-processed-gene-0.189-mRNA-1//1//CDS//3329552407//4005//frame0